jgi:4-diphosphocytidyl-2-C-methyl-D-erythritol kinase
MTGDPNLHPILRLAPAKLNLTLAVRGQRPDGYHDLHSVMVPLGLADVVSVAWAAGTDDTLAVVGFDAGPVAANLVLAAIGVVRAACHATLGPGHATPALAARLEKRIPVAAGLAGGSSDAAAAIDAALEAWGADRALDPGSLADLRGAVAARIGSDVPFFLAGGAAVVTGRGEGVEPLPPLRGPAPGILLVTPAVPVPTPAVFAALHGGPAGASPDPGATARTSEHLAVEWRGGLRTDALVARAGVLASANDLVNAAVVTVPGLRELRRGLVRRLTRPVGLSGSGPTLWVLYASLAEAATAAEAVRAGLADGSIVAPGAARPSIVATTITASGPAPEAGSGQGGTA